MLQHEEKLALSRIRLDNAFDCLNLSKKLIDMNEYKASANRSYYAVFYAMRAVLAFDGIDMKKHSGVISEFRRLYIKTGIFDDKLSKMITNLFSIRQKSDYNDFYIISKEQVLEQYENARLFIDTINCFLKVLYDYLKKQKVENFDYAEWCKTYKSC